jgi:hypothetical protein
MELHDTSLNKSVLLIVWQGLTSESEDFSDFKNLQTLELTNCSNLTTIYGFEHAAKLKSLVLRGAPKLSHFSGIQSAENLNTLFLQEVGILSLDLPERALALRSIKVMDCPDLFYMSPLTRCPKLTHLTVEGTKNLKKIEDLGQLSNLVALTIAGLGGYGEGLGHKAPQLTGTLENLKNLETVCLVLSIACSKEYRLDLNNLKHLRLCTLLMPPTGMVFTPWDDPLIYRAKVQLKKFESELEIHPSKVKVQRYRNNREDIF